MSLGVCSLCVLALEGFLESKVLVHAPIDRSRLEVAHSSFPTQPAAKGRSTPCINTAVMLSIYIRNLWS